MYKKLQIILLLFLACFANIAHPYDWDKCKRSMLKTREAYLLALTTISPIQYTSSWGACSAMGKPEDDRKAFFNDNFSMLKINFARGSGEYVTTFINFYKCSNVGSVGFLKIVRNNFKNVFGTAHTPSFHEMVHPEDRSKNPEDWPIDPEESFLRLQNTIEKDEILIKECKILK